MLTTRSLSYPRLGFALVTRLEWSNQLTSKEMVQVKQLLKVTAELKACGLTVGAVSISFCRRLTQHIKDRVRYEYSGPLDLTREVQRKVTRGEVASWVSEIFCGVIKNKRCPKAYSLKKAIRPRKILTLPFNYPVVHCISYSLSDPIYRPKPRI